MKVRLFSPAKVNLFLRVLGRREDGFHNLASLFQAIDLGDTIELALSSKDQLICNHPNLPTDDSNLICKSIHLFRKKTGLKFNIQATLDKHIPQEAGLGGGSSNAATTLWGLNELLGLPLKEEELRLLSAEIGSDIPFFFSSGTAYCTGRGEYVRSLAPLEGTGWIVKPDMGLSTALVFSKLRLDECSSLDPEELLASFYNGSPLYHNDLEKPAFSQLPFLRELKESLLKEGEALLTGSGTAFFCKAAPSLSFIPFTSKVRFVRRKPNCWYEEAPPSFL